MNPKPRHRSNYPFGNARKVEDMNSVDDHADRPVAQSVATQLFRKLAVIVMPNRRCFRSSKACTTVRRQCCPMRTHMLR